MKEEDLNLLRNFIAYQSISTDNNHVDELEKCKFFLNDRLKKIGFELKCLGNNSSVIYAKRIVNKDCKTMLIYGHYDVQPAGDEGWNSDPFLLQEKGGKFYARGIADNKGQIMTHIFAVEHLIKASKLDNLNLIFLIEGEEEVSSPTLKKIITENTLKDKIDMVMISDSLIYKGTPALVYSCRGNISFEIELQTLNNEAHSGIYGGALLNAANESVSFINRFKNEVSTFLQNSDKDFTWNPVVRESNKIVQSSFDKEVESISIQKMKRKDLIDLATLSSSLEIIGIKSGYTEEGVKNIIPSKSLFKFNLRYIPTKLDIWNEIELIVEKISRKMSLKVNLNLYRNSKPFIINIEKDFLENVKAASKDSYNKKPLFKPEGGSISIVELLQTHICDNICMFGFADLDSNIHGANENMNKEDLEKAMKFSKKLLLLIQEKA